VYAADQLRQDEIERRLPHPFTVCNLPPSIFAPNLRHLDFNRFANTEGGVSIFTGALEKPLYSVARAENFY